MNQTDKKNPALDATAQKHIKSRIKQEHIKERKKSEHVILDYTADPPDLRCKNCGDIKTLKLPMKLDAVSKICNDYAMKHALCEEMEETA